MPTEDSWRWFTGTHEQRAPAWRIEITRHHPGTGIGLAIVQQIAERS